MNRELPRKAIHALTLLVPLSAARWLDETRWVIAIVALLFAATELIKVRGGRLWIHRFILPLEREGEKKGIAKAPLLLSVGVLIVVSFFSWPASFVAIWLTGFSDVMAAVVGRKWKIKALFYNRDKSLGGTLGFFLSALPVTLYFYDWHYAIPIAITGSLLESLPLKDWDNFTVPVGTGLLAQYIYLVAF